MALEFRQVLSKCTKMQTQLSQLQLWSTAVSAPFLSEEEAATLEALIAQPNSIEKISQPVALALAKHIIEPDTKVFIKVSETTDDSSTSSDMTDTCLDDGASILDEIFEDTSCPFDYIDEMAELRSSLEERDLIILRLQCIIESMTNDAKLETIRHDSGIAEDPDEELMRRLSNISLRTQQLLQE